MNRQRKLTWIEKKQIEKVAFDHPFFEMHGKVLSKKEAKAIIRSAEMRKSGIEIVSEACDRAGVPRPDFVDNHYTVFENLKEVIAIPAIRRIGIIAIALILLIVFFTATPTGRAIAESVIQYIVTLFDDGRLVVNQSDTESSLVSIKNKVEIGGEEQNGESDIIYLQSFDEFISVTGKTPIILPLQYSELYYLDEPDIEYLALYSTYETSKGKIVAYQIWGVDSLASSTLTGFTSFDTSESVYYSIEENGKIEIRKFQEDSIYCVSSKGNYTLDDLINMLIDH